MLLAEEPMHSSTGNRSSIAMSAWWSSSVGVTKFISIDNLKAGVDRPDLYDPRPNRAYAEFAEHHGTFINRCRVATFTDKAIVERLVPQARELFRRLKAVHPTFNLAELNGAAREWCLREDGMTNHGIITMIEELKKTIEYKDELLAEAAEIFNRQSLQDLIHYFPLRVLNKFVPGFLVFVTQEEFDANLATIQCFINMQESQTRCKRHRHRIFTPVQAVISGLSRLAGRNKIARIHDPGNFQIPKLGQLNTGCSVSTVIRTS
jgi:hypothetical protein